MAPEINGDVLCSLTHVLPTNPVVAQDGRVYDLEAIDDWLYTHGTSPVTLHRMARLYTCPAVLLTAVNTQRAANGDAPLTWAVGPIDRRTVPTYSEDEMDLVDAVVRNDTMDIVRILEMPLFTREMLNEALVAACHASVDRTYPLGTLGIVRRLLDEGADVNYNGGLPLYTAARSGNQPMFKLLVKREADVHASNDMVLRGAVELYDNHAMVRNVLEEGARDTGPQGNRALLISIDRGYASYVALLCDAGADVQQNDNEALILACETGHYEMVDTLLKHGANPEARDGLPLNSVQRGGHRFRYIAKRLQAAIAEKQAVTGPRVVE